MQRILYQEEGRGGRGGREEGRGGWERGRGVWEDGRGGGEERGYMKRGRGQEEGER